MGSLHSQPSKSGATECSSPLPAGARSTPTASAARTCAPRLATNAASKSHRDLLFSSMNYRTDGYRGEHILRRCAHPLYEISSKAFGRWLTLTRRAAPLKTLVCIRVKQGDIRRNALRVECCRPSLLDQCRNARVRDPIADLSLGLSSNERVVGNVVPPSRPQLPDLPPLTGSARAGDTLLMPPICPIMPRAVLGWRSRRDRNSALWWRRDPARPRTAHCAPAAGLRRRTTRSQHADWPLERVRRVIISAVTACGDDEFRNTRSKNGIWTLRQGRPKRCR